MKDSLRLAVVHRHRLFRECLTSALSDDEWLHVVDLDHTAKGYLEVLEEPPPDVVVIDLDLSDRLALDLTRHIRERIESARVIVLASADCEELVVDCIEAGAQGCFWDESSVEDLRCAVRRVAEGETFYSPQVVQTVFEKLARSGRELRWRERLESVSLTRRELDVLNLIAERLSNKEIAKRLCVSLYTVKNHVHNIVEKLRVENRFEAVDYARSRHWLHASRTSPTST